MTLSPPVATIPGPDAGATVAPGASIPIDHPAPGADSLPSFRVTGTHKKSQPPGIPIETHQVKVAGRLTCISLEYPFWRHLHRIAFERATSVNAIVADVARSRGTAMLSRALRVFLIADLESRAFPGTFAARSAPRLDAADRAAAALTSTPRRRISGGSG